MAFAITELATQWGTHVGEGYKLTGLQLLPDTAVPTLRLEILCAPDGSEETVYIQHEEEEGLVAFSAILRLPDVFDLAMLARSCADIHGRTANLLVLNWHEEDECWLLVAAYGLPVVDAEYFSEYTRVCLAHFLDQVGEVFGEILHDLNGSLH
jgi:hypothetical protein